MKSLRFAPVAFLVIAIASAHAADKKSDKSAASPSPSKKTAPAKSDLPDPVATVDGKNITKAELETEFTNALKTVGKSATEITPEQKAQGLHTILDDMIIDRILRKSSADVKVSDEEIDKALTQLKAQFPSEEKFNEELKKDGQTIDKLKENVRISLQQQKWIESQIASKVDITDADAKAFYDGNPDKFKMPPSVRASHILFAVPQDAKPDVSDAKKKLADATEERIKKGEDFGKLATELSDDPGSKANGGDLNFFTKEVMVPEFADAAFKMKVGDVSEPVKTQFGWHIIKVTDKKDAKDVSFDEAKPKIIGYLQQSKKRGAVKELIESLRAKADVKIFLAPLPTASAPSMAPDMPPGN